VRESGRDLWPQAPTARPADAETKAHTRAETPVFRPREAHDDALGADRCREKRGGAKYRDHDEPRLGRARRGLSRPATEGQDQAPVYTTEMKSRALRRIAVKREYEDLESLWEAYLDATENLLWLWIDEQRRLRMATNHAV